MTPLRQTMIRELELARKSPRTIKRDLVFDEPGFGRAPWFALRSERLHSWSYMVLTIPTGFEILVVQAYPLAPNSGRVARDSM